MKYNIKTLKKEVPESIRLEIYKEALERIDFFISQGFCIGLPKIMLNIGAGTLLSSVTDSETSNGMRWFDTKIAFPELTQKVIILIGECETDSQASKIRENYLREWIRDLEKRNTQTENV